MSCCSVTKAVRKLGAVVQSGIDPIKAEASRIESKTRAEAGRFPNNIDKGLDSAQAKIGSSVRGGVRNIQEVTGEFLDLIPGLKGAGQFVKFMAIGLGALLVVAIVRRARK